jgi:hypothetical protein
MESRRTIGRHLQPVNRYLFGGIALGKPPWFAVSAVAKLAGARLVSSETVARGVPSSFAQR